MRRWRPGALASAALSILGMASLSYVIGAGAMFYQVPTSEWMANAFAGARRWADRRETAALGFKPSPPLRSRSIPNGSGKTYDGLTLYTCAADKDFGTQAFLIDMQREVVHRWATRFSDIWPNPTHVDLRPMDRSICFFGTYLYPNGDLLVICHGPSLAGFGLAKLDKDSNVVWAHPATVHHDVDVAEDGTIYGIRNELIYDLPAGAEGIATPCYIDYLVTLSSDGKPLRRPISILAALLDSPYAELLAPLEKPAERHSPPSGSTAPQIAYGLPNQDILHTNCVRVLRRDLAAKFPGFKAGHLLISIRNLSVVAMLDPENGRIEWATRGPWLAQHDPQFLDSGNLLIFDNLGSPKGTRVLEYNPRTQELPWSFVGATHGAFYTSERGMCQRLPNGNTFILDSEGGEMMEVTHDKVLVWSCKLDRFITSARRYGRHELTFLDGGPYAQPE